MQEPGESAQRHPSRDAARLSPRSPRLKDCTTLPLSALVFLLLPALSGCQLVAAPFIMWGAEPTKSVPADYPYLAGKKACVVIWVEPDTLFDFPNVQFELSEFIINAVTQNVKGVTFTPSRKVIDLQRRGPEWERTPPAKIGGQFGVDRVLVLEITQYSTREPDSPHLFRGRINANLKVYDAAYPDADPVKTYTIETAFPPDSPGKWGSSDASVRRGAMEAFADAVAKKFYDHKVKIR